MECSSIRLAARYARSPPSSAAGSSAAVADNSHSHALRLWLGRVAVGLLIATELVLGSGGIVTRAACAPPAGHSMVRLAEGRGLGTGSPQAPLTTSAQAQ